MSCPRCTHRTGPASSFCDDHAQEFDEWLQDHEPTAAQRAADHLQVAADRLRRLDRYGLDAFDGGVCKIAESETCVFVDLKLPGVEINLTLEADDADGVRSVLSPAPVTAADFDRRAA